MQKGATIPYNILLLVLMSFFAYANGFGQASVNAQLNSNSILMGEQVKLNVQVSVPVDKPVTSWYNLPDTFNHIEILNRSNIDSAIEGSVKIYQQHFTITSFDSGIWKFPSIDIISDNKKVSAAPLDITIVPAKLKDSTYHDIREIIGVPVEKTPWWYWVAGALSLVLLGVLVWLWIKNSKAKPTAIKQDGSKLSPLEEAIQKLRDLRSQELPEKGEWKKYYSTLGDVLKAYTEKKYHAGYFQKTTDEILIHLNQKLSKEALGEVAETLRISDAVKFARYQPELTQASPSINNIEKTIKSLDSLKQ
ncbi:MAG: hypothetical protein QM802_12890 [Agriterribacter sp.]